MNDGDGVRLIARLAPMGALLAMFSAACVLDDAADVIERGVARYCSAGEAERALLREQLTTSKGPLIQVNCENLE